MTIVTKLAEVAVAVDSVGRNKRPSGVGSGERGGGLSGTECHCLQPGVCQEIAPSQPVTPVAGREVGVLEVLSGCDPVPRDAGLSPG